MATTTGIVADESVPSPCGHVGVVREANRWVLNGSGEHDMSTAPLLSAAVTEFVSTDVAGLVVDLRDVTFMDCSTVRVLIHGRSLLASRNRTLTIRGAPAMQQWFMELCGLADLIDDIADETAGLPHSADPVGVVG